MLCIHRKLSTSINRLLFWPPLSGKWEFCIRTSQNATRSKVKYIILQMKHCNMCADYNQHSKQGYFRMPQKYVLLCSFKIFPLICGVETLKAIKAFAFFSMDVMQIILCLLRYLKVKQSSNFKLVQTILLYSI